MKQAIRIAIPLLALGCSLHGQTSFETAQRNLNEKITLAKEELREINESIAEKKLPLSRELKEIEGQVLEQREVLKDRKQAINMQSTELSELESSVKAYEDQNSYMSGLLNEYVRTFESRVDISELAIYAPKTAEAKLALEDANLSATEKLLAQIEIVELSIERINNLLGGHTFDGSALNEDSDIVEGTFAIYGPYTYFYGGTEGSTGLVQRQLNTATPAIVSLDGRYDEGIGELIQSGTGPVPVDATMGKAIKILEVKESYWEHIQKGSYVGFAILGLGLIGLLIAIYKTVQIFSVKIPSEQVARDLAALVIEDKKDEALQTAGNLPEPAKDMLITGIKSSDEFRTTIEERMYESVVRLRPKMEQHLPFLAIIAGAAPLMGLLGTVIGMIKTFKLITVFGTGDAQSLSSGISEALVTTELGLTIAIPALILHGLLNRFAKHRTANLEQLSMGFLNHLK
jgi:biopolymer transport protein ExbB